ncbi:MAG: hypothetical protein F6K40_04625 [Okeania sp. SIO3I5]|nr:hypothetical protein [Okeania sp. SIO3I5]NEQ35620.1 hypothetical protein [Okeania sp. SIO3I5]
MSISLLVRADFILVQHWEKRSTQGFGHGCAHTDLATDALTRIRPRIYG